MMPRKSASSARLRASSLLANWWFTVISFIASAKARENFATNSPYLPSLECLSSSRHKGSAIRRISESVFSTMFMRGSFPSRGTLLRLRDEVVAGRLFHRVLAGVGIAAGHGEHVPVLVVQLHGIPAIVVAGPTRLLAEERVVGDALGGAV